MFAGRPIIGLAGGIGSGKSFVAALFAEMGCAVIDSDAQARAAYRDPAVLRKLREWWGDAVFRPDGTPDRARIAQIVFNDPRERDRLEGLIHPRVAEARDREMKELARRANVVAFVWDTPLLLEAGLNKACDAVVYIDVPSEVRRERVAGGRGWDGAELARRENLQYPLDRKREISDYVISNAADAGDARRQVRDVLTRILQRASRERGTA